MQKNISCLDQANKTTTKMVTGQVHKSYEERLYTFGVFPLRFRHIHGDLCGTFKIVKVISGIKCEALSTALPNRGIKGTVRSHTRFQMKARLFTNSVILLSKKQPEKWSAVVIGVSFKKL